MCTTPISFTELRRRPGSSALTPNDFPNLQALTDRLTTFAEHYRTIARPFDWTFTRNDLNQVLAKIADREPDLRLAA